jgi:hypothetical protein
VLLACVRAADPHDRDGARPLVDAAGPSELPSLQLVWADQGYTGQFARWLQDARGWRLDVVSHRERRVESLAARGDMLQGSQLGDVNLARTYRPPPPDEPPPLETYKAADPAAVPGALGARSQAVGLAGAMS